ncbi:enoyl-CoA hydratase/isomerase family protein [Agromyces archimandritae]|uniref:Enoyl-CoA hydratase/isomerase family protein n=1 Tax=Agromyces archimandritae TaxID=2781962 RepID=A0A975IRA6_9MICO|nr:enoyl-CoA hydratase/isomerase family protein [Agromyces archimandritae]QTX05886.1 enoyl-CoA hydratase/isomerase family protein [Agromyces archimandritae]
MSDPILFDVTDGLARITLNRPERLNAIDPAAAHRWREIGAEVAGRDDIRAVILDAAGRAFCAGGDVVAMSALEGDARQIVAGLADAIHDGHRLLRESSVPIVAAVQGPVAGGGLGFMLVADVVIASEAASFAGKYADIGLTPDCGVSTLVPEAVGIRRGLELLLTPRMLDAATALDWGLVAEVVAPESLAARTEELAAVWTSGASAAYGQTKRLVHAGAARDFQASLDDEARTIGAAFVTPDAEARIAAFAARSRR